MLLGDSTKYGAGFRLVGDYLDLRDLYETIHYFASEDGPIPPHHDEFVLGLAYDVRHAYQGNRDTESIENSVYFSVDILWPILLVQVGMLRASAAYVATTKAHQAALYRIEACIEEALNAIDANISLKCCDWLHGFSLFPQDYLISFISQQTKVYVFSAKTAKSRIRNLPEIIMNLSPLSPAYRKYEKEFMTIAEQQKCKPNELHDNSEWPEFKW